MHDLVYEQSAEKWNIWWLGSGRGLAQLREAAASNHTAYLNLPEEKDAHATGDAVEDLLRQKMVTSAVNWTAKNIGRLADF